jgi:hypothetical protein
MGEEQSVGNPQLRQGGVHYLAEYTLIKKIQLWLRDTIIKGERPSCKTTDAKKRSIIKRKKQRRNLIK